MNEAEALQAIEAWFRSKCDDDWEHRNGPKLESKDDPGWLMTVSGFQPNAPEVAAIMGPLLLERGARVSFAEGLTRIYAQRLTDCVIATAQVLQLPEASWGGTRGAKRQKK